MTNRKRKIQERNVQIQSLNDEQTKGEVIESLSSGIQSSVMREWFDKGDLVSKSPFIRQPKNAVIDPKMSSKSDVIPEDRNNVIDPMTSLVVIESLSSGIPSSVMREWFNI